MLTRRENEILACTAIGLSAKEIAGHLCRSEFTVLKTIANVKEKVGLQKSTELTAHYWIDRFGAGVTFNELKRQILSITVSLTLLFATSVQIVKMEDDFVRFFRTRAKAVSIKGGRAVRRRTEFEDMYFNVA